MIECGAEGDDLTISRSKKERGGDGEEGEEEGAGVRSGFRSAARQVRKDPIHSLPSMVSSL